MYFDGSGPHFNLQHKFSAARRYGASIIEWLVREGGAVGAASVVIGVGSGVNV